MNEIASPTIENDFIIDDFTNNEENKKIIEKNKLIKIVEDFKADLENQLRIFIQELNPVKFEKPLITFDENEKNDYQKNPNFEWTHYKNNEIKDSLNLDSILAKETVSNLKKLENLFKEFFDSIVIGKIEKPKTPIKNGSDFKFEAPKLHSQLETSSDLQKLLTITFNEKENLEKIFNLIKGIKGAETFLLNLKKEIITLLTVINEGIELNKSIPKNAKGKNQKEKVEELVFPAIDNFEKNLLRYNYLLEDLNEITIKMIKDAKANLENLKTQKSILSKKDIELLKVKLDSILTLSLPQKEEKEAFVFNEEEEKTTALSFVEEILQKIKNILSTSF